MIDPTILPAWHDFAVPVFGGRETHKHTGEPYPTMTLRQLFNMEPLALPKLDSMGFIPSTYHEHDAREHAAQRERGRYVALTADIDSGDHPREKIEAEVGRFAQGVPWLVYSSSSSRPGNRKWRAIVPLASEVEYRVWRAAQTLFHDALEAAGVEPDRSLARAGQVVYAPNVPAVHVETGTLLRKNGTADGAPLYFERTHSNLSANGFDLENGDHAADIMLRVLAADEEENRRREASEDAARKRKERTSTGSSPIERFNAQHDVADLLAKYGYEAAPHSDVDWRSPNQTNGSYGTRVYDDDEGRPYWISLSGSDAAAGLGNECGNGCHGDAFDLFVHYEHGGDRDAALAAWRATEQANDFGGVSLPPCDYKPADNDNPDAATASRFRLLSLDDLDREPPQEYVVKGVIGRGNLGCIFGPPGAGKSVLAPYVAIRVAQGLEVFGMRTKAGPVLYVAAEDAQGMGRRLRALRSAFGQAPNLHMVDGLAGVMADDSGREMAELIVAILRIKPVLIVIDTLAGAFPIDENASAEMSKVVSGCLAIAKLGPAVLLVHHSPKSDTSTPRGHSVLNGALDVAIKVEPADSSGVIRCHCTKNRNGFPRQFGFRIRSQALGVDADGDPISAPVCDEVEIRSLPSGTKLSAAKLAALSALDELAAGGELVRFDDWRTLCIEKGRVSPADDPRSRGTAFNRAAKGLTEAGMIIQGTDQTGAWVARPSGFAAGVAIELPDFESGHNAAA